MIVRWWPHNPDPAIASTRLRCHRVIAALSDRGHDAGLYDEREAAPDVLVLLKRYDANTVAAAERLRRRYGTRVVLDLCDNHFYDSSGDPAWIERAAQLRCAVASVDQVVAATPTLADRVREQVPTTRVVTIGDIAEGERTQVVGSLFARAQAGLALARLQRALERTRTPRSHRLVWFGNHGSPNADGGMTDLLRIQGVLEAVAAERRITLTVISNHRGKFRALSKGWRLPLHYLDWNAATFSRALRLHGVSVIPVGLNPFTACKTSNRVCTSLLHDLAVVADPVPSYLEFSDAIRIADWRANLLSTLDDTATTARRIELGRTLTEERYGVNAIISQWLDVLALSRRDHAEHPEDQRRDPASR